MNNENLEIVKNNEGVNQIKIMDKEVDKMIELNSGIKGIMESIERDNDLSRINLEMNKREVIVEQENLPDNIEKYKELLKLNGFLFEKNKLVYTSATKKLELSNFLPILTEQVIIHKNKEEVSFRIKCILIETGEELEEIEINSYQLEKFNFIYDSSWVSKCYTYQNNGKYLALVCQILARETLKKTHIYKYTGFERINGKLVYLYHNGYIGETVDNIETDLSEYGLEQYCFTNKNFEEKETIELSYSMLDLANQKITIPLVSTIYLAPLSSLLKEENIYANYTLAIVGKTSSFKSSASAVCLDHFGNFNADTIPTNFKSTANSLERALWVLKDNLLVIDNFESRCLDKGKVKVLSSVLESIGDKAGRGRLTQKGIYTARGIAIITAEFIPELPESKIARTFIVNVNRDSIDKNRLTMLQENKEKLALAEMCYIKWIIKNEEFIKDQANKLMKELRKKDNASFHGRMNQAINVMTIGYNIYLHFLNSYKIIDEKQINELTEKAYQTLLEVGQVQEQEFSSLDPVDMVYEAINSLIGTEKIHLLDKLSGLPETGYNGKELGFIDKIDGYYFFYPRELYSEINKYYDYQFPLPMLALWRYLDDQNCLYKTAKADRRTVRRVNKKTNRSMEVIGIKIRENDLEAEIEETTAEDIINNIEKIL